ncbi:hypothetical protein RchiOBHm_Chr6g0297081 [Rosa chinensis]|uniref:Uncharacterized protein n=1 Tax=Rosa chinensis TaxID=74649 RepID=A0A2P6PXL8_ROSCH|nr:hypothetical protein RchiOBHm_Chr6g0297081 [Rosa chinensis]
MTNCSSRLGNIWLWLHCLAFGILGCDCESEMGLASLMEQKPEATNFRMEWYTMVFTSLLFVGKTEPFLGLKQLASVLSFSSTCGVVWSFATTCGTTFAPVGFPSFDTILICPSLLASCQPLLTTLALCVGCVIATLGSKATK